MKLNQHQRSRLMHRSLLTLAILSAYASPNSFALTVDNEEKEVSEQSFSTSKMGYAAINVKNNGHLIGDNLTVSTTGTYSDAISVSNNSIASFNGGVVTTAGGAASGFHIKGGTLNIDTDSEGVGTLIEVNGKGATGIRMSGGKANVNKATIVNRGTIGSEDLASAIEADPNSAITVNNSNLQTLQDRVHGALIKNAKLSLNDTVVSTSGNTANSVHLLYASDAKISNSLISSSGIFSHGVRAANTSNVSLTGSDSLIHTTGESSRGVYLFNDAQADISDISIITDGDRGVNGGAEALTVQNNAKARLNGVSISINGIDSDGLEAKGGDPKGGVSQIAASSSHVVINGDLGKGALAYNGNSTISMINSIVETNGNRNDALVARDLNSSISTDMSLLKVTGDSSGGASALDGGVISMSNSEIQHSGDNGYGFNVANEGSINATNSIIEVSGNNSDAMTLNGGSINLDGSQVSALKGKVMNFISDISAVTAANGSLLKGDAFNAEDATSHIVLDDARWEGNANEITSVGIKNGAQWITNGNSTLGSLDLDKGSVIFDPVSSAGGDNINSALTVHGNFSSNDGQIAFNSVLGDDNSATNKLIVEGDTSGNTGVSVNNLGGKGAKTYNGIELIRVGGESAGLFTKSGRIVAGAYEYDLVRGKDDNSKNWYLVNAESNGDGGEGGGNGGSEGSGGGIDPVNPLPTLRPETGSYAANQAAVNNMFIMRLHDRLGETKYIDALTGEKRVTSLWMRTVGGHSRFNDTSGQLKTQENRYVVQLGGDIARWSTDGLNRYHLGVMGAKGQQWGNSRSKITGARSENSVNGYSLGGYGTWYQNDEEKTGSYVDTWAQYSWFNNSVNGENLALEKYKSSGLNASVEAGYTWKLGHRDERESYFIQPKAQVIWNGVKSHSHTEQNGTRVEFNSGNNVTTRLGFRAFIHGHNQIDDGKQREFEPFIEANWIHNTADYSTSLDGIKNGVAGTGNIGEIKLGIEGKVNPRLNIWGNVGQQMGGKGYSDTSAIVGVKVNF